MRGAVGDMSWRTRIGRESLGSGDPCEPAREENVSATGGGTVARARGGEPRPSLDPPPPSEASISPLRSRLAQDDPAAANSGALCPVNPPFVSSVALCVLCDSKEVPPTTRLRGVGHPSGTGPGGGHVPGTGRGTGGRRETKTCLRNETSLGEPNIPPQPFRQGHPTPRRSSL